MGHDGWMQEVIHWLNQPELEADEMWEREGARLSGASLRQWWGSWSRELRQARWEERQLGWEGSFRLV